ncbi:hypothetical protein GCM10027563_12680 [Parasphingorhabdus pacifica]
MLSQFPQIIEAVRSTARACRFHRPVRHVGTGPRSVVRARPPGRIQIDASDHRVVPGSHERLASRPWTPVTGLVIAGEAIEPATATSPDAHRPVTCDRDIVSPLITSATADRH